MFFDFLFVDSNTREKQEMAQTLATNISENMSSFIQQETKPSCQNSQETSGQIKTEDSNVRVNLQNKEMWDKFHSVGTEMIITKAGRYV